MELRGFRSGSAPPRRAGALRTAFVAAALIFGGVAVIGATSAAAGPAVTQTMPVTYGGTNPCTGETFLGSGNVHFLLSENLSATGVLQHHLDVRIDGLQAVTPAGKKYVVQDTFNDEFVFGGAAEETFDITAHFIRIGDDGTFILGDDFYEYLRTQITANANGIPTAFQVNTSDPLDPCQ
jgi:hypothetical protein